MNLSEEDVQKILRILDELEYTDIRLEIGDFKLHLQKNASAEPEAQSLPASGVAAVNAAAVDSPARASTAPESGTRAGSAQPTAIPGRHIVESPIGGIFYRAPTPGAAPFVRVGDSVAAQDTVCLLEVMKLFNSVAAGVAGRVVEMFAENGQAVAQGQALLAIEMG